LWRYKLLSSDEQPSAQVRLIAKRESKEIDGFLGDSVLRQPSSVELEWNNFAIERRTTLPYEESGLILQHHFLILWDVHVAEGETAYRNGDSPLTRSIRTPSQPVILESGQLYAVDLSMN
jgi:hypothetical protein